MKISLNALGSSVVTYLCRKESRRRLHGNNEAKKNLE